MPNKRVEMIGLKFGKLTVVQEHGKSSNGGIKYLCKCDCGGETVVAGGELRRGKTTSCGHCLERELTGKRFDNLEILEFVKRNKNKHIILRCKCDCGNIFETDWDGIRNGNTHSCGKCNINYLIGKRFGKLVVQKYVRTRKMREFECLCDCGNTIIVNYYALHSGHTKSCGCINSGLEVDCINYFIEHNIPFKKNVRFDDLVGTKQGQLSYDFMVGNFLIECQGLQHYKPIEHFGGEEKFEIQQSHDKLKREYAENNGYVLIEIKYNEAPSEVLDKIFCNMMNK